jgi:phage I-like protein
MLRDMDLLCSDTRCVASTGAAREGGSASSLALCEAEPAGELAFALTAELALAADGKAPDWVELLPAGDPLVSPRDGRKWRNPDPAAVLGATKPLLPLPIDLDHAGEVPLAQRNGTPAPAVGWIEELAERQGAIWARVVWTAKGGEMVRTREYRYLSPAFAHTSDDWRVLYIASAALVNKPAFPQLALSAQHHEDTMTPEQRKALCAALGLPDTATDAEIVTAAQKQKADKETALAAAQTPPLDKFVPRGDYDAQVAKATASEAKLAEQAQAEQAKAIDAEISAAVSAKKITPATADYYRAMCAQAGGLDKFKEFVKAAPVLAPDQVITGDPAKKTGGDGQLTADQLAICRTMGMDPEAFAKARAV